MGLINSKAGPVKRAAVHQRNALELSGLSLKYSFSLWNDYAWTKCCKISATAYDEDGDSET